MKEKQAGFAVSGFLTSVLALTTVLGVVLIPTPDQCACEWKAFWTGVFWTNFDCAGNCASGCEPWLGPASGAWHCVCDDGGNICVCYGVGISQGAEPPVIVGINCHQMVGESCSNELQCLPVYRSSTFTGVPGIYTACQCMQP